MTEKEKKDKKKQRISKVPVLIRSNGRVYIGCDLHNQRFEMCICDHKACRRRKKCTQYIEARTMKAEWEDIYGPSKTPLNPKTPKKRRRRRNSEQSNIASSTITPQKRKRKRKQSEEETHTPTKKRRRKQAPSTTKRKRKRKN